MHDLAIVVTSMNEAHWLRRLLPTIAPHAGATELEVVVADVESTDDLAETIAPYRFARSVPVVNRGFAHANNVAMLTTDSRYVLYLNPDTEIVEGTFESLLAQMDERPEVGLAGVRQLTPGGDLYPTMRRFTTPGRRAAEALWAERLAPRMGRRVLDLERYASETSCDWTIGSFMLVRREAVVSAGVLDERFFFTAEEQDLCLRIRDAGWDVRHLPSMTIVHHAGKRGFNPKFAQQSTFAELQYARKHFGPWQRRAFRTVLVLNHGLRLVSRNEDRRTVERASLATALGRLGSPFLVPPRSALPAGATEAARRGIRI